jgi:protein SCO1/2
MSDILSKLGAEAGEVVPVFITVDPERDTPEALKAFRASFDNRIIMLSGTPDEINTVIADYHIYAKKVPLKDGNYTMDHTASVFLFDRQLRLRSSFDFHEPDKVIFDKVRLVLDGR